MKPLLFVFGLAVASSAMAADAFDYAQMLRENGNKYCSGAINVVSNWLVDQSAGSLSQWNIGDADNHFGILLASKRYSDGNSFMHLSAMKTPSGGCDVSFSLSLPFSDQSCTALREKSFKAWKFYGEIQGIPVYDDPTTNNVQVALQQSGQGCVTIKMGVLFYDKKDIDAMAK